MKKLILAIGSASAALLLVVGVVAAVGPHSGAAGDQIRDRDELPGILGLTESEVAELRQDGLSLAQIAERQSVDAEQLVEALAARWTERIEARVTNGALTADQAAELRAQVELQARNMVNQTTLGGMHGAAVGAGAQAGATDGTGNAAGRGWQGSGTGTRGTGTGTCDGSGRS
ncbi:MAG: hypothetical protein EPO36_12585 [Chloroflexota bacterium]|nr:MAG: hypothetical protein EPO36_12585 [Chloroflexota bacterium]